MTTVVGAFWCGICRQTRIAEGTCKCPDCGGLMQFISTYPSVINTVVEKEPDKPNPYYEKIGRALIYMNHEGPIKIDIDKLLEDYDEARCRNEI